MKPYLAVPSIALLVHRAWSRKSLTPLGLIAAALTAVAHAVHPWSVPFFLLVVFYIGGTTATKVKHDVKSRLTLSASGAAGGEGQRNHIQVLANSIVATVLILLHTRSLQLEDGTGFSLGRNTPESDVLVVGIVANYAAVAADTFSSELGILSNSKPRLITSLSLRVVPPGTNGGVTATGLLAGVLGAFTVAITSAVLLPFDLSGKHSGGGGGLYMKERAVWALVMTVWGALGSVLDSVLGSLVQASVVDKMTGKVVEGSGGRKVLIHRSSSRSGRTTEASSSVSHDTSSPESVHLRQTEAVANAAALKGSRATHRTHEPEQESRRVESGRDLLDNNTVNVLMAAMMSLGGMGGAAWLWGVLPL